MATWLNDYKNRKLSLEPLLQRGKMTVQELLSTRSFCTASRYWRPASPFARRRRSP